MTAWAQVLHFYQPPTQTHDILRRVAEESYRPLVAVLREHPAARVAVNMNAVLTELLAEHGLGDVVRGLAELAERGQVEFVGSGKSHPILPLIPAAEAARTIADNAATNAALFGKAWAPKGFFPPELCYGAGIAAPIAAAGHRWLVLSGIACPAPWPMDRVHRLSAEAGGMAVLFRDDVRSNRISFRETTPAAFIDDLAGVGAGRAAYVVTAMDAETYGHHIKGWERDFLAKAFTIIGAQPARAPAGRSRVAMAWPSEVVDQFPAGTVVAPRASSWSTSEEDIARGDPYPLWRSPGNVLHRLQWRYVEACLWLLACAREHADGDEPRKFFSLAETGLGPALHSCQFWWASRRPMWDPVMVQRGLQLLSNVALWSSRAIATSDADDAVQVEARARMAGADEDRWLIERELAGADGP